VAAALTPNLQDVLAAMVGQLHDVQGLARGHHTDDFPERWPVASIQYAGTDNTLWPDGQWRRALLSV
jgi:hypothetical protein